MSSRPAVLVKHTEHPEGNTIENPRLNTVNCEETIGDIFDLIECLIAPSNLKQVFPVDNEVAFSGIATSATDES